MDLQILWVEVFFLTYQRSGSSCEIHLLIKRSLMSLYDNIQLVKNYDESAIFFKDFMCMGQFVSIGGSHVTWGSTWGS